MSSQEPVKYCSGCNMFKVASEFYQHQGRKDSLSHQCKECTKAKSRQYHKAHAAEISVKSKAWRERNKEYKIAQDRKWRQENPERKKQNDKLYYENNKERILEQSKEYLTRKIDADPDYRNRIGKAYRERHYNHRRAQEVVAEAIKAGKLPPAKECFCAICGEKAKEYHHWSYQREHWLDVTPLCLACHRAQDAIRKQQQSAG